MYVVERWFIMIKLYYLYNVSIKILTLFVYPSSSLPYGGNIITVSDLN